MSRLDRLKSDLSSYSLEFTSQYNIDDSIMDEVDNHRPPTTFVDFFYTMCDGDFPQNAEGYASPPSQQDFALAFFFHHQKDGASKFTDEYKDAWIRRAQVAYPSLVRDMQFIYLLSDYNDTHSVFDSIDYDPEKDIKEGVDAIIEAGGETYYVNLYVDTQKSRDFLDTKKNTRHPSNDATELHLTVSRNDSRNETVRMSNGEDIWLYSEAHVEDLIDDMNL